MVEQLKTYSLLIAWNDNQDDEGEYGWTGRAKDPSDAEDKARRDMFESYREEGCSYLADTDEPYDPESPPFGRVLECQEGAIWEALSLEESLRSILEADTPEARDTAYTRGRELIAKIDAM